MPNGALARKPKRASTAVSGAGCRLDTRDSLPARPEHAQDHAKGEAMTEPRVDVSLGAPESEAVGVSSRREARLDLLLAEELSVDHDLVRWFLTEAGTW